MTVAVTGLCQRKLFLFTKHSLFDQPFSYGGIKAIWNSVVKVLFLKMELGLFYS